RRRARRLHDDLGMHELREPERLDRRDVLPVRGAEARNGVGPAWSTGGRAWSAGGRAWSAGGRAWSAAGRAGGGRRAFARAVGPLRRAAAGRPDRRAAAASRL